MADAFVTMRMHESREVFASLTPESGTLTLSSSLSTLYDSAGAAVSGVSGATSTGITSGASSAPKVWHRIAPTSLSLTPGVYSLSFKVIDSNGNTYEPVVAIHIEYDYD